MFQKEKKLGWNILFPIIIFKVEYTNELEMLIKIIKIIVYTYMKNNSNVVKNRRKISKHKEL